MNKKPCLWLSLVALLCTAGVGRAEIQATFQDPQSQAAYDNYYGLLNNWSLAQVTGALRSLVERIAARSGKSNISETSTRPQVQGFESALLQSLQDTLCPVPSKKEPLIKDARGMIELAGKGTRLDLTPVDVGRLTALSVRLSELSPHTALCHSTSLDDLAR